MLLYRTVIPPFSRNMAYPHQPTRSDHHSGADCCRKLCPRCLIRRVFFLPTVRHRPATTPQSPHLQPPSPVFSLPIDPLSDPTFANGTWSDWLQVLWNKRNSDRDTIKIVQLLLNADNFLNLAKIVNQRDAERLIEVLLYLLDNNLISQIDVPDANCKAKRFVIKIAARLTTAPKSLFLNPDEIPTPHGLPIGAGGLAVVYEGSYRGAQVALKYVRSGKIDKAFLQEALTWRMLSHKHILPFIGIFVDRSQSFISLVSPFMENGTLRNWRQTMMPSVAEIKKRMHEVAEGLAYLHAEGIVHGDLKGNNVLLDNEFHVKISDFGSTKHMESTATKTWGMSIRFAAPELFSDEEDQPLLKRTKEADIYAFGCLYYEIHFGILPFGPLNEYSIIRRVKMGRRPVLHHHPLLDENGAGLINQCWNHDASKRPRIEHIADSMCLKF